MTLKKRYPQRICTGCRRKTDKKDLIRIVRTPEGEFTADLTGKKNGRGAYVCKDPECLKKALKTGALSRALKAAINDEEAERIVAEVAAVG